MASFVSDCASTSVLCLFPNPISLFHPSSSSSVVASFPLARTTHLRRLRALRTGPDDVILPRYPVENLLEVREDENGVDWEDKIFEDTLPLISYVKMILNSKEYGSGDKLNPEHEKTIRDRLLPYHPDPEKKIGPGIDYITIESKEPKPPIIDLIIWDSVSLSIPTYSLGRVGYHPNFLKSRCLFIVRTDGEMVDFSYKKCIKGLVKKKYPRHAEAHIFRYLR